MSDRATRATRRREERAKARARGREAGPGARAAQSPWRGPLPIAGLVVVIALIVVYFVYSSRSAAPAPVASSGENAAVAGKVTSIPPEVFDQVKGGTATASALHAVASGATLKSASGKPVIVYVGAEYCPYCASERWSVIAALSRFGTWSGLGLTSSSSSDVYPNTPTFTFRDAQYTSDLIELSAVETSDRQQKPLQSPNATQQSSLDRFDPSGSIPFISIADRYYQNGAGYPPDVLAGKTWDDIATALANPASPIAQAVLGNADRLTAAICAETGGKPASVCTSASVKGLLPAQ